MAPELASAPESLYWYWIRERHTIFERRQRGCPKPWTDDEILLNYKFTNVFRELDTGTIWLRKNFLEPHRHDALDLLVFNICWYRMFNWTGTGALLGWLMFWPVEHVRDILVAAQKRKEQVFTNAHIVRSAFGRPKIAATVDVCADLFAKRHDIVACAQETDSLQSVFKLLMTVKYVGPFMAYEMVTDMRHTRLLSHAHDIMTWANAGPGAIRGLRRLHPDVSDMTPKNTNMFMRELLERSVTELPPAFPRLEMRDIEHCLCEFDKYCRVKFGEGKPRMLYHGR